MSFALFANASTTPLRQTAGVLGSKEILRELQRRGIKKSAIAETLDLDPSRVTELYALVTGKGKPRRLLHDEAVKLVEVFGLEQTHEAAPLPDAIVRLLIRHVAQFLSAEPTDEQVRELTADLQAFARFVADPQVRESLDAAEGFFRAMRLRRPGNEASAPSETAPQNAH